VLTTPAARTGRSQICAVLALDVSQLELLCSRVFPDVDPPPDRYGGRPPVPGWRRLAAVLAYLRLPRATLRRAGAVVGVGRSTVARALRELLPTLAGLGLTQPDGSVLQPADLHEWLAELAAGSELVLIDGTVTEIPRPALASTRRLFWNVKHACYSYQSLTVVTPAGDFLALTSGWPGKVHELDALDHAAFLPALVTSKVLTLADRGFRGAPARTGAHRRAVRPTRRPVVQAPRPAGDRPGVQLPAELHPGRRRARHGRPQTLGHPPVHQILDRPVRRCSQGRRKHHLAAALRAPGGVVKEVLGQALSYPSQRRPARRQRAPAAATGSTTAGRVGRTSRAPPGHSSAGGQARVRRSGR